MVEKYIRDHHNDKNIKVINSGKTDIINRIKDAGKLIKKDFLVLYGDLAKELRAFADVADAWVETLPNRPRKLARDEPGVEA